MYIIRVYSFIKDLHYFTIKILDIKGTMCRVQLNEFQQMVSEPPQQTIHERHSNIWLQQNNLNKYLSLVLYIWWLVKYGWDSIKLHDIGNM